MCLTAGSLYWVGFFEAPRAGGYSKFFHKDCSGDIRTPHSRTTYRLSMLIWSPPVYLFSEPPHATWSARVRRVSWWGSSLCHQHVCCASHRCDTKRQSGGSRMPYYYPDLACRGRPSDLGMPFTPGYVWFVVGSCPGSVFRLVYRLFLPHCHPFHDQGHERIQGPFLRWG